jgi:hypothetical protein
MNPVDSLAAAAERDGTVPLPALSQAELCALGAAGKGLVCQRTWTWWTGLGEDERAGLTVSALELLAVRGLIRPGDGSAPAVPSAGLAVILTARLRPEPVVVCQAPGHDAAFCLRFFGMTAEGPEVRVLVRETLTENPAGPTDQPEFGTLLRYALVTPDATARQLAGWADSMARTAGAEPSVIDVFGHYGSGRLRRSRLWVHPADGFFEVRRDGIMPGRVDEKRLCQILATMLTGAA